MAQTSLRRGTQDEGNTDYFTGCPIGGGFIWYGLPSKIPSNCRVCDNSTLAIENFAKLHENLDGAWGTSGGNLNIPDLRGRFPRGVDGGAGNDPDALDRIGPNTGQNTADKVGSVQEDTFKSHTHTVREGRAAEGGSGLTSGDDYTSVAAYIQTTTATGDSETRPKNANVYFVIRVS